jgi:hypothetical protein
MFDKPDLTPQGTTLLNGKPLMCENCDSTHSLQLYKRGWRETWPAFLSCLVCGKGADRDDITNGLLDAAKTAATGRQKASDRSTFRVEWRGTVLEGELIPEFVLDDAIQGGKALAGELRAQAKEMKAEAKSQARSWWGGQKKAARAAARQKAGGMKAAALGAAWQMQTGGAGPQEKPRARRCPVKGCRKGTITLTTRVHGAKPGRSSKTRVPCGVCHRNAGS